MDDFSLADAIEDDTPGQASKTRTTKPNMPASTGPQTANFDWQPGPGAPHFPSPGAVQPSAPSDPRAKGPYPAMPTSSDQYPPGPGAPGHYAGTPSFAGGYPSSSQNSHGPGAPGLLPFYGNQYPAGGNAPGQFPGGAPLPYLSGIPGATPGPFSNLPYPGGPSTAAYGPGVPGSFSQGTNSSAFSQFPGGGFPPIPSGTWGPVGPFPAQQGHSGSFNPNPMGMYPNPSFGGQPPSGGMLDVPFHLPLHAGIMPRLMITIMGEPTLNADRFHVNFVKEADIAFHFNPRFNEETIVRNANLGGHWGPEEREGPFPFVKGKHFELKVLVEEDMFKVAVDGTHLLEFEHRVGGLGEVTQLCIEGDVLLHSVAPSMI